MVLRADAGRPDAFDEVFSRERLDGLVFLQLREELPVIKTGAGNSWARPGGTSRICRFLLQRRQAAAVRQAGRGSLGFNAETLPALDVLQLKRHFDVPYLTD